MSHHLMAIRSTAVLSVLLWTKVFATNLGLGGAKNEAGTRAPEDSYQKQQEGSDPETVAIADRAQRMVNNDLENIPYTMILAWGAMFCIYFAGNNEKEFRDAQALAHIALFTMFVLARIAHSIMYALGISKARTVAWLIGLLCSFGIGINGAIAAFQIE